MKETKLGIFCYVPPTTVGNCHAFLKNIQRFKTRHPIIFYGYHTGIPGAVELKQDPEFLKNDPDNRLTLANAVFFTGLKIAIEQGFTHMLALEADCRVGCDYWDDEIWKEFLSKNPDAVMGGSAVVFNPAAWSREAAERYEQFVLETQPRLVPISVAGSGRLAEKQHSCVFTNGALSIYNLEWMKKAFWHDISNGVVALAKRSKAWDYEVGIRLWNEFDYRAYEKVVSINCVYSGYGELMTNEMERRQWLADKRVVAVHQIKSAWVGPEMDDAPVVSKMPSVEILLVTFKRDYALTRYALYSIRKFATGFKAVKVVVPTTDEELFKPLEKEFGVVIKTITEAPGKGMLEHLVAKCWADRFCESDYILHMDSDCIFTEPVTPLDYFRNDLPVLVCRLYSKVNEPGHSRWKQVTEDVLKMNVDYDYMVRHPAVHVREVYEKLRQHVVRVQKMPFREFVVSGRNEYPQTFCEFVSLGQIARMEFPERYHFEDISDRPEPKNKMTQGWTHGGLDKEIQFKDGFVGTHRQHFQKLLGIDSDP
jgi:hypothetical protein